MNFTNFTKALSCMGLSKTQFLVIVLLAIIILVFFYQSERITQPLQNTQNDTTQQEQQGQDLVPWAITGALAVYILWYIKFRKRKGPYEDTPEAINHIENIMVNEGMAPIEILSGGFENPETRMRFIAIIRSLNRSLDNLYMKPIRIAIQKPNTYSFDTTYIHAESLKEMMPHKVFVPQEKSQHKLFRRADDEKKSEKKEETKK